MKTKQSQCRFTTFPNPKDLLYTYRELFGLTRHTDGIRSINGYDYRTRHSIIRQKEHGAATN
jgi:hypothetical protein